MLDHVSITVSDLARAEAFYDAVFTALGIVKVGSDHVDNWIGYGLRCDADHPDRNYLSLRGEAKPEDVAGRHWCFKARTRAAVDTFWQAGIAHGGRDNGKPGLRSDYHDSYYAAFLIDPDGNCIEAVCHHRS